MFSSHLFRCFSVFAIGSTLLLTACNGADGRKVEFMERGNQFYAQENYDKARLEFKNVLQIDPKNVEALYQLGQLDELSQNWRSAASNYQRVIDIDAENVAARVRMGRLYLLSGAVDKAIELAEQVLVKAPENSDALVLKAAVLAKQQKLDEAAVIARQVVEKDPSNIDAIILLAGLERVQGNTKEALALLQQGAISNPKHLGIKLVLAETLGAQGDSTQGAQILRDVIALKPDDLSHRLRLAAYLEANKEYVQAESVLRDAVAMDDDQARVRLVLVNFIHQHGTPEQSAAQLQEFINKDPKAYTLQFAFAAERERVGQAAEAISAYRDVIKSAEEGPAGLTARSRLARLLVTEGNTQEAEQLIAEVLKKNANDSDALLLHASMALTKGDAATAVAKLRNVLRDQPDNLQALKMLAQAHALNNEQALASETLQKAAALAPKDMGVKLGLAEMLMRQGKLKTARLLVEEVLAADTTQQQALEAIFKFQMADKEWPAAEATAATMLKAHPDLAQGNYYSGVVLEAQGKTQAAIASFHKALEKNPEAVEPLLAIVKAELSQRQPQKALTLLDSVIKKNQNNFVAHNLRGEVLMLQGKAEEAEKSFSSAIGLNPKIASTYRNLGTARLARDDMNGAFKAYEEGMKQLPDNEMLAYSMAALDERQGEFDRAISRYETLLKRNPNSAMAKNNLAMLLVTHRSDQESLNRARDLALTLSSSSEPAYLDTVGWVQYRRAEIDQALATLEGALKKVPSAPQINYHLGMVYYTKGDSAAALRHLEQALSAKVEFQGIDEARTTLKKLKSS